MRMLASFFIVVLLQAESTNEVVPIPRRADSVLAHRNYFIYVRGVNLRKIDLLNIECFK